MDTDITNYISTCMVSQTALPLMSHENNQGRIFTVVLEFSYRKTFEGDWFILERFAESDVTFITGLIVVHCCTVRQ